VIYYSQQSSSPNLQLTLRDLSVEISDIFVAQIFLDGAIAIGYFSEGVLDFYHRAVPLFSIPEFFARG